uniref:Uncharacterized protein n=1 Tax=Pithovirus LCPAC406 TaxID=2506599 RepID=A0A481ZDP5_9VIRU|nr:MAG: hypothetical protein LCPAC406_03970 [Pithovirus LCPAC406]
MTNSVLKGKYSTAIPVWQIFHDGTPPVLHMSLRKGAEAGKTHRTTILKVINEKAKGAGYCNCGKKYGWKTYAIPDDYLTEEDYTVPEYQSIIDNSKPSI